MKISRWAQTLILAVATITGATNSYAENPQVALTTEFGVIELELMPSLAPRTVKNFLDLVDAEFYDGLVFHRVIANFMIQAGGYTSDLTYKPAPDTVPNESFNGLKNKRGTVAMARMSDPDSASSQFFINVRDNRNLDADGTQAGYTVFAKVSAGMDVVSKIELVNTHLKNGMAAVPEDPVIIISIKRL